MPLITTGSINDFSVGVSRRRPIAKLKNIKTFAEMHEAARETPENSFDYIPSLEARGIGLKSLKLTEGFEGFFQNLFDADNEIYFVAYAWDLSNQPVCQYPGAGAAANDVIIPIKVGKVREFIGEGINLFPKRVVSGGIALRIHLWESDKEVRNFGKAMSDVADAVQKSKLNNLLSLISLATGVSGATVALIKEASLELAKVVGTILQSNGDDYVDFFEGYYAADQPWPIGPDRYAGNSSEIVLNKY